MGFDLGGEFVRFYMTGTIATATPLPLYTMRAVARPLRDGEWFYLTDLYWLAPNNPAVAYVLFDDHNDDGVVDAGETIARVADVGVHGGLSFNVASPTRNPKVISVGATTDLYIGGHGVIRSL